MASWLGTKRVAFIPVLRSRAHPPDVIPPDIADRIRTRVLNNPVSVAVDESSPTPHPKVVDRSLRAWLRAASSGRADIDPTVLPMQTSDTDNTLPAEFEDRLGGELRARGFDHAVLVSVSAGGTNQVYWSRVLLADGIGPWLMEIIHGICDYPDLYDFGNDVDPPDRDINTFDQMSASTGTHPTMFTKLKFGWADGSSVANHADSFASYDLQLGALPQPPAGGLVAAVRIGDAVPYVMIEARTKSDAFDVSIKSEGVIAYRVQWEDPKPRVDRPGFRKPLYLLTETALQVGESATLDYDIVLTVSAAIPGGFSVTIEDPNRHIIDRTARSTAQAAASVPAVLVLDERGTDNVCFRDGSGHLREMWRQNGLGSDDLTTASGAPGAKGNPAIYFDPSTEKAVLLYRGQDHRIHSLFWLAGDVGHDLLSGGAPEAASDPVGWFSSHDGFNHVAYRADDGHLVELWWQGAEGVGSNDLTAAAAAVAATGDPCAYYDSTGGSNIVVFRGTDNHIRSLYWASGAVGHDDLSGTAGVPAAADDPFAWHTPADNSHHFVYRTSNGHIYELSCVGAGPLAARDLTAISGAPTAHGKLSGGYNADDNTQHIIYRDGGGKLHELWYSIGSDDVGHTPLTQSYGGPPAADRPIYFSTARMPHQHVAYRAANGHIHELLW
jgi:hypothetical protein